MNKTSLSLGGRLAGYLDGGAAARVSGIARTVFMTASWISLSLPIAVPESNPAYIDHISIPWTSQTQST